MATDFIEDIAGQVQDKLRVVTAMSSKLAVAQDPQTEIVLNRDCLNVSSVTHVLRVHGQLLAADARSLIAFDEGARTAMGTVRAANLGGIMLAALKIKDIAAAATRAGLRDQCLIEKSLEDKARQVVDAPTAELHGNEKAKAAAFLQKADEASETQWRRIITGLRQAEAAPDMDTTYRGDCENDAEEFPNVTSGEGGAEGGELPRKALSAAKLQSQLSQLQDCTRLRMLEANYRTL